VIWIILPGLVGVLLVVLQKYKRVVFITGTVTALALVGLAWRLPIGEDIAIGSLSILISDTLTIFGRRFVLDTNDQSTLLLIYLSLAFWFIGTYPAKASRLFIPIGLAIDGLLTAALAVEPFLFAALIVEMIVLVSIPLLIVPGSQAGRGVIRYLVFQTLGFPFILFTGWLLTGATNNVLNPELLVLSYVMMGLGFWFLLGIFPFHSWIPMISEESHPYSVAFLLYVLPLGISLFALGILDRYTWLRETIGLFQLLEIAGVLMIFIGGVWAAFQRNLGRLMGCAILVEIGLSVLAVRIGVGQGESGVSLGIFFATLFPRALSLGVWALAMVTIFRSINNSPNTPISSKSLTFKNIQGAARRYPVAAFSLLLAQFSLAGFPLLVGFQVQLALWVDMARYSSVIATLMMIGYLGLMVGGLRTMAVLVMGSEDREWEVNESIPEGILLTLGGLALIIMGVFPQIYTPFFSQMANVFFQTVR
jgi:formate hydrogenlyase subunit 3/multisubunit Na+/H+ antiporter MnhD subunit